MALILCKAEAKTPYYYERLDLHIYSLEELAYALGHYLYLVPEHFCRKGALSLDYRQFGRADLRREASFADRNGGKEERLLFRLIRESGYYSGKRSG